MSNRLVSNAAIDDLRRAAQSLDWNQWASALDHALAELMPADLIPLAEAVLRNGLAIFERHNPDEQWPRRALDGLETGLGLDHYPGAGGNSFASGVEDLVEARTRIHDPDACRALIRDALSRSVMAAMCAAWGAANPDKWQQSHQFRPEARTPGTRDPMDGWSLDPEIQQIKLDGWNDVIDRLEALTSPVDETLASDEDHHAD